MRYFAITRLSDPLRRYGDAPVWRIGCCSAKDPGWSYRGKMITTDELNRLKAELETLPSVIADARRVTWEQRRLRHLSVRTAADQMGVPPTTLARFEKSVGTPRVDTVLAVLQWIAALPAMPQEGGSDDC